MKNPAAFLHRILISDELGQSFVKSQSLRFLARLVNCVQKNSSMSLSTISGSTSWSLRTSVMGRSDSKRNPERILGSGRPVMKNLTLGIFFTLRESIDRMADEGSSSLHSSRASMIMRVGMLAALSGPTMSFSICEQSDSCPTLGCVFKTQSNSFRKSGSWWASWKASVGKIAWRLLRSSKSREQKKLAPSFPSANAASANVWAMVDFPVPAGPFSQKTCWSDSVINQCSISQRTSFLVPLRHPCLFPQR